jgi:predicted AAA+ superfamily ATPase
MARCVHRASLPGIPLSAYEDPGAFKVYFVDIGLFARLSGIEPSVLQDSPTLFREMKGSMAENLVLQSLSSQFQEPLCYWSNARPQAEVDFLASLGGVVVPIEVKAATNIKSPSLRIFMEKYGEQTPLRVRFSMQNLSLDGDLLNIPLFMSDEARRLMLLALEKRRGDVRS